MFEIEDLTRGAARNQILSSTSSVIERHLIQVEIWHAKRISMNVEMENSTENATEEFVRDL